MNLNYCRFRNTLKDLSDCEEHLEDELSEEEAEAREKLIRLCVSIADYEQDIDNLPKEEL